jgi:hypothetical protein
MRLKQIDKGRYKTRFRVVFVAIVAVLLVISLAVSTFLIATFSTPEAPHFWHNLGGVLFAGVLVTFLLSKFRHHPYLYEVVYVWDLKQALNRIHRKQKAIEAKVADNDRDAMIILNFMYQGSKQLYELDDNTITMDTLLPKLIEHEQKMQAAGIDTSTEAYQPDMLDRF